MLKNVNVLRKLSRFAVISTLVAGGLLAWGATTPAQADEIVVKLSDLLQQGATIASGDKVFSNFTYLATGNMPTAADINVVATQIAGNFGLLFQGAFLDLPGGGGSDAMIGYTVTIDPQHLGLFYISDAHLDANISAPTGGFGNITDSFFPDSTELLTVTEQDPSDAVSFAPDLFTTLHVQKDILLYAPAEGSPVTVSLIYQTYSQTGGVPEPGTMMLLGTGAFGLFGILRRRMLK